MNAYSENFVRCFLGTLLETKYFEEKVKEEERKLEFLEMETKERNESLIKETMEVFQDLSLNEETVAFKDLDFECALQKEPLPKKQCLKSLGNLMGNVIVNGFFENSCLFETDSEALMLAVEAYYDQVFDQPTSLELKLSLINYAFNKIQDDQSYGYRLQGIKYRPNPYSSVVAKRNKIFERQEEDMKKLAAKREQMYYQKIKPSYELYYSFFSEQDPEAFFDSDLKDEVL